jgi:hypothetical protein
VGYNKVEQLETEEEHEARLKKEHAATGKTLYDQLQEREAIKKAEYEATTKAIFGRPLLQTGTLHALHS